MSPPAMTTLRAIAALALLAGCSDPAASPPPGTAAERCALDDHAAVNRLVAIGSRDDTGFSAYEDGQELELILGFQGGYMITPAVRVEAAAGDPDRVCVSIRLTHALLDGDAPGLSPGLMLQAWLDRTADGFVSGTIDDLLELDPAPLDGHLLSLGVEVGGPFAGAAEVEVLLRSP